MNLLLLGPSNAAMIEYLVGFENAVTQTEDPIDLVFIKDNAIDFIVSYGYRHIIKHAIIEFMAGRIINLHISYLPWNRGADPNLWSFLEDTPKGVTIHYVDEGIDTGDIIAQKDVIFDINHSSLATTYAHLQREMISLFKATWPLMVKGVNIRRKQPTGGTYHRSTDKVFFLHLLTTGRDTLVAEIVGKGIFYLRPVRREDREEIYRWRNSPDVARYMYTDHHITEEEHNRWFESIFKDKTRKYWIIVYDKEEIGLVNLYNIDQKNRRCFGAFYITSKNVRGKGVGSLIEYHILKYVFENLNHNKLCCEVLAFNEVVVNMHKNFGFHEEGYYRQHIIKSGKFTDVVALAMLRSEWDKKKPEIEKRLKAKGMEI